MTRELCTPVGAIRVARCGVDDAYILDWCPWRELSDVAAGAGRPSNAAYRTFHESLHRAYGGHAVAAWEGSRLIGILTFFPEGAVRIPAGWEYPRPCGLDVTSCLAYSRELDLCVRTDVLLMGCVGLHIASGRYRRQGIAMAMVAEALEWGRDRGYRLARAYARADGGAPEQWDRSPDPEASFWRRAGFVPAGELPDGRIVMSCHLQGE